MQQSRSISEDLEPFRSKLYLLNGDNGWLDQGTGYPIIVEEPTGSMLKFAREDSGNVVYQVTLTDELQFEQQDEKIFTWYNKRTNVDMALSFQNGGGSDKIWQKINEIVANKRAYFGPFAQAENMDELISTPHEAEMGYEEPKLTDPNENNLGKFEQDLMNWSMAGVERKNALCHLLCGRKSYIAGLIEAFRKSEEAKSKENLTSLFRIFRQMINLAHYELYSILLSDEYYLDVFGALEYDPEREGGKNSITHRKYFQEHVKFNQVGTIKDPNILRLIHWNFRLMYLRDCVLAHYLDERILQFISAIVHSNYIDILKYVHSSREVLSSLFDSLRSRKLTALKMIHEMCLIMKNLDVDKVAIFEVFAEYNIFETFEEIMIRPTTQASLTKMGKKDNKKGKDNATDEINVKSHLHMILEVLMLSLVQAPHCLRDYCISQPQKVQKYPLLSYIVEQVTNHEDSIIQNMLGEVVKHLIDASEPDENPLQGLFYEKFLIKLIEVFDKPSNEEKIKNAKSVVLDLLIYCAKQQMPQLTKYIVPLDIPGRIFKNFEANDKFLILVIIQLYKLLLLIREPEVVNSLCKQLDHIIDYFLKYCKNKSNLLHSSLLEVFVLIIKEEIFLLLNYIIEKHKVFMQDPACAFITNKLKEKYRKMTTGDTEGMVEEQKQNSYPFNLNARKGKASLTIISPFGSVLAVNNSENSRKMGPTSLGVPSIENSPSPVQAKSEGGSPPQILSPSKGGEERPDMRRTSSNLAKLVDYDDEMEFNMETRGKDVNFMLEDIQLKKRKIDELNNSVTVINK